MTDGLIEFLRARIADDEQAARAAGGDSWTVREHTADTVAIYDSRREPVVYDEGWPSGEQMEYIARYDPARVLAEVDAKQRILAECAAAPNHDNWGMSSLAESILQRLALPYANHSDYRSEWAPDA
ncbi:hypothetical protein F7Q99_20115 [Streptomyces kaniharaensis]|uniref:Uncharacterized protein n=1 Tax=Streptomyces kaniharaensis TaxID=212423 RepID=A0A6N7KW16_9ACTN|nr:DUF6221 family protein [Streptomyces kaniharaensis]MQS14507.1 hypothetical protein [Streptomyces kaniharaensis]